MDYFPAFLNLDKRRCLIVGGGPIALRKARLLTSAGARVLAVAPQFSDEFQRFAERHSVALKRRKFRDSDVAGHWLVVSATGHADVEHRVSTVADQAGVFCNGVDSIADCSFITPAIVDRGSIVVAISSGGAAPVLARKIREQIEALLPSGIGNLARLAKNWRARVRSAFATVLERRRFWESVFDGPAGSLAVLGQTEAAEAHMTQLLQSSGVSQSGEAWLVGAGPGDPGLLTLRALQALQQADVILHDRLVADEILNLARRDADLISVGKTPGSDANSQEEINALLVSLVARGRRVCRLKGGDPFIFGRGGEEAQALADAELPFSVVPGITAAAGCAASAGIPLTHRDAAQSVTFVTAHGKASVDSLDWAALARDRQTLAFYMSVGRFATLMEQLVANGKSAATPIAVVENGTRQQQRVVRGTLGQLTLLADAHKIKAPAMLFVGEVAALSAATATTSLNRYAKDLPQIAEQG